VEEFGMGGWKVLDGYEPFAYREEDGATIYLYAPPSVSKQEQPRVSPGGEFLLEQLPS
jgi:hypothetical protein